MATAYQYQIARAKYQARVNDLQAPGNPKGISCGKSGLKQDRNDLSFEEWMDLDVKYVKERSFWVDWKIIFKTFKVCLLGHGE